jgi:hypothetical protein
MKRLIFAGMLVLGAGAVVHAADLNPDTIPLKAAAVAPAANWTGCYVVGLMGATGANGVSGGPDAGGQMECLTQNGGFVYGPGIGMLFTKLSAGNLSSPLTADMDLTVGYAIPARLGTVMGLRFDDLLIWVAPAIATAQVNSLGTSTMNNGWMVKGGIDAAQSYTPTGQVASTIGIQYRESKIDNIEAHTWMATVKMRFNPPL